MCQDFFMKNIQFLFLCMDSRSKHYFEISVSPHINQVVIPSHTCPDYNFCLSPYKSSGHSLTHLPGLQFLPLPILIKWSFPHTLARATISASPHINQMAIPSHTCPYKSCLHRQLYHFAEKTDTDFERSYTTIILQAIFLKNFTLC